MALLRLDKYLAKHFGGVGSSGHNPLGRKIRFGWWLVLAARERVCRYRLRGSSCLARCAVLFHIRPSGCKCQASPTTIDHARTSILGTPHMADCQAAPQQVGVGGVIFPGIWFS